MQEKHKMLVIRRVCHLRGDMDILIDFVCLYILNYTFGGNVMDSETSVEELKVWFVCRQASRYKIIIDDSAYTLG